MTPLDRIPANSTACSCRMCRTTSVYSRSLPKLPHCSIALPSWFQLLFNRMFYTIVEYGAVTRTMSTVRQVFLVVAMSSDWWESAI